MNKIDGLRVFATADSSLAHLGTPLRLPGIKEVICCALGPKGNNIEQAATKWLDKMGIVDKGKVVLRDTPELCLELARSIKDDGVVAVFWTCAVYSKENEFFFGNPDVFPFFFQQSMLLDDMQLATRKNLMADLNGEIPIGWRVASHPSPAPLMDGSCTVVVLHNSNAAAARACANEETELCITTESARQIYELVKLYSFGSPEMIFFGGITQHGLQQIRKTYLSSPDSMMEQGLDPEA